MDSTNILAIAIVSLSAVLIAVGIYAIVILREIHRTTRRVNNIVSRIDSITEAVDAHFIKPGSNLASVLTLLKEGAGLLSELRQTSSQLATNSQIVGEEVKKAGKTVRETAPVVAHHAKEVISDAADQGKDVVAQASEESHFIINDASHATHQETHHASHHAQATIHEAASAAKEVVHSAAADAKDVVRTAKQPEPMKAESLATRRRFFTRK